ncbi:MAG: hypothetical protein MJZ45_01125 [Bacteroidales bacterium]|nr:hypothetical protein [Bacteroidales bacterium]
MKNTKNIDNNSRKHVVRNATVKVHAPKPMMGRTEYAPCSVIELSEGEQPAFIVTPLPAKPWSRNERIYYAGHMKVHTRKDGSYMLTLAIDPESDKKQVEKLQTNFKETLSCTFAHSKARKEGEE